MDEESYSETRDGMRIDWDVPIVMDDGVVLRADIFRPIDDGRFPVIMNHGPYGKGRAFQESSPTAMARLTLRLPRGRSTSSGKYQNWETVDPERWVPAGYVCLRVDSRGSGRSPGVFDIRSPRETADFHRCIEWAAAQPWSNGRIGLAGISYYATNQYQVAATQPPHLVAICPWEGAADCYRDIYYHGGILCENAGKWFPVQVRNVQHGLGTKSARSPHTGRFIAGPETLSDAEREENRVDLGDVVKKRKHLDTWYRGATSRLVEGRSLLDAYSRKLGRTRTTHTGKHRGLCSGRAHTRSGLKCMASENTGRIFYSDYGVGLQMRFFDHYLKGCDNGWEREPPVRLQIRHVDGAFTERHERDLADRANSMDVPLPRCRESDRLVEDLPGDELEQWRFDPSWRRCSH